MYRKELVIPVTTNWQIFTCGFPLGISDMNEYHQYQSQQNYVY